MMAGRMKLRSFVVLVGGLSVVSCVGGNFLVNRLFPRESIVEVVEVPVAVPAPAVAAAPAVAPSTPTAAGTLPNLRDVDLVVSGYVGKPLGSDKLKDVTSGQAFKVNVYQDGGSTTANRAKVDLDRDDKWDEKWTFQSDGTIQRQTAPNDDEQYTVKEVWQNGAWVTDAG
jgi:hypothetical protein